MIVERIIIEIVCDYCGSHLDRRDVDPTASSSPHWPSWRDAHAAAIAAEWTTATGPVRCPSCRTQFAEGIASASAD